MATLDVRGKFLHSPGPWGVARPAAGVDVENIDIGNPDDSLWRGTTNTLGAFAGAAAAWRDRRTVTVGIGPAAVATEVADLGDVMLLQARLSRAVTAVVIATLQSSALVAAAIGVVARSLPSLLRAAGFGDAARELETTFGQDRRTHVMMIAIVVVCAMIASAVALPGAGWARVVEAVTGAGGARGLSFVFSR